MKFFYGLFLIVCCHNVFGQIIISHWVGYRNIYIPDTTRRYKPGVSKEHPLYYRSIDIDVWYPALRSEGEAVRFGELIQLFEDRARYYQEETNYEGMTEEMMTYLAVTLNVEINQLNAFETSSFQNARPIEKKFPLIIYMASFNGMSFENVHLFERLASAGYVVACVNSVGRYPGNMTTNLLDVREQIEDAVLAKRFLSDLSFVDSTGSALIGYSWGSVAACLGDRKIEADAIVSLDGSECHRYGLEDDGYFSDIREELMRRGKVLPPYLYLQRDSIETDIDSVYAHQRLVKGSHFIKIKHSTHEDFSSLPYIASRIKKNTQAPPLETIQQLTIAFLDEHVKQKMIFRKVKEDLIHQNLLDTIPGKNIRQQKYLHLSGVVSEKESSKLVPYASIGLLEKKFGTVSNADGEFTLLIPSDVNDTLKISSVGFEDTYVPVKGLDPKERLTIQLLEKTVAMEAVTVETKRLKTKVLGHTTRSKFFGGKLGSDQLGTAIGVRMNIRKPVLLDQFRFTISYSQLDTALFRLNILTLKDGVPHESLIQENIYCRVGKRTGTYTIDLLPYQITASRDVVMALEWIEGGTEGIRDYLVFSASPANNGTYLKYTSQGKWKRFKGMGVGFHVTVRVLDEAEEDD